MKRIPFYFIFMFFTIFISCELFQPETEFKFYHKCFFIAEDSFTIEGDIFLNDKLTKKADFEKIIVKTERRGWEIEGTKTSGNKYTLNINTTANEITLPPEEDAGYKKKETDLNSYINISDFPYVLDFYVDGRITKGACLPDPDSDYGVKNYYYAYIPEAANLSREIVYKYYDIWRGDCISYTYYDYNFKKPGWYKIYSSENPIGNNSAFSSGKNTKIRAPN